MGRYLIAVCLSVLAACSTHTPSADQLKALKADALAYPETLSERAHLVDLRGAGSWSAPRSDYRYLPAFSHHIKADAGVPSRLQEFEVLYHAPNRYRDIGMPFVPVEIPDRLEIVRDRQLLVDQPIPGGFTGAASYRALEVAKLRTGGAVYLLVLANGFIKNPLWLGIFSANGEPVYRTGLPHGAYRFVENADGISFVDESGNGKRVILLP